MDVFQEVYKFYLNYDEEKGVIGYSKLRYPIYYFAVRKTAFPVILIQYSMHAREYITAYLGLEQIKDYILNGKKGTVYFVPLTNPDGVKIAQRYNPLYKANAKGVDLNQNFDAKWGSGKLNTDIRGTENYIGKFPFSESETNALKNFTLFIKPDMTLSYHSKGEEIYYEFFQTGKRLIRDRRIAKKLAKVTHYTIKSTLNSAGGYKDWCIDKLNIPSFTIEVGNDNLSHPIGKEYLKDIFQSQRRVIKTLTELKCKKIICF